MNSPITQKENQLINIFKSNIGNHSNTNLNSNKIPLTSINKKKVKKASVIVI